MWTFLFHTCDMFIFPFSVAYNIPDSEIDFLASMLKEKEPHAVNLAENGECDIEDHAKK